MNKDKDLGKNLIFSLFDYVEGIVYVRDVPDYMESFQQEEIADYFARELVLSLDDCEYMVGNLSVDDTTNA